MAVALRDLPRYVVIEGESTLRLEMRLEDPACEIDVSLDNPKPGRSFVLLIGHPDGPFVQRVRLAGRARIFFDPKSPGTYVLLLVNPDRTPIVLRLRARGVGRSAAMRKPAASKRPPGRARSARNPRRAAKAPSTRAAPSADRS